jgi:hypothetical protein
VPLFTAVPISMVATFPNEVLLQLFAVFPLKSLIIARGVNRRWRHLVPHSAILPARRALLDLYYTVISSPLFLSTRDVVFSSLHPFDRQKYINILLSHNKSAIILPDEFLFWLLEWPTKAVFGWTWPGLDARFCMSTQTYRPYGRNCLRLPPIVQAIQPPGGLEVPPSCRSAVQALEVWEDGCGRFTWLLLQEMPCEMHTVVMDGLYNLVVGSWTEWLKMKPEVTSLRWYR